MQVWTNVPQTLNVTVAPASIQAGQRSVDVTISNLNLPVGETALICVQKGTEIYETKTVNTNGTYTIPITAETAGTVNVTVTAHNYFPVEKTVQITTSTTPNPIISSVNFIDNGSNGSIGNSNGQNDAGETICLQVELKNNGGATANNLTTTISSTSNYINVLNNSFSVGSIAANGIATAQFLYKIDKNTPETLSSVSNHIQFKIDIEDASNAVWTHTFSIDVFATDLFQRNKVNVNTNNNVVTFNIELQNMGQAPATGITAILKADNSTNSVSRTYPVIGRFETKTATSAFQFTIPSGYTAVNMPFKFEVTNAYGKTWTFPFSLAKPVNIDGLDFVGGEKEMILTWNTVANASGYNIYRCNVGTNNTESGNYIKLNTTPISYKFFEDKYNLATLTKYYYKVAAVSSSGMEGDALRILAWTSYPTKGMFPIQMNTAATSRIVASINADDVNNDGYPEFFTTNTGGDAAQIGYLIGLDHEGIELFDIDNNVTTYSGFAKFNASMQAPVAIGDLFATGESLIVSVSRDMSTSRTNYVTCHTVKDTNNDHLPDMLWQKPTTYSYIKGAIISNIDNSSDGSKEIILKTDGNSGGLSGGEKIQVLDNNGNVLYSFGNECNYAAIAVADLDGDGNKEIIAGYSDGVYIWHHDGTPYSVNPVFSKSGYNFKSSPVICDLDGDGQKEIVIAATNSSSQAVVYALKPNGTVISGWGTTAQTFTSSSSSLPQEISVGDLYNNENLHVVAIGSNIVKVWNKSGNLISSTTLPGVSGNLNTPILADVDGDNEIEILVASQQEGKLYGIKPNGTSALGFPLRAEEKFDRMSPCVIDLDNNGKSEIIAATGNKIYVWETNGNPNRIEWGFERHDPQNTGEYFKICPKTIISSSTIWNSNKDVCSDIIVESGTLTLNSSCMLTMNATAMIIVKSGANLVINGGKILNANIKALPQSSIILKNNGYVKLRKKGDFTICLGATFDNIEGNIEITQ